MLMWAIGAENSETHMTYEGNIPRQKSSVLVINDIEIDSIRLNGHLKNSGYNPIFVSQSGKGLTLLQHAKGLSNPIRAVICDAEMSGTSVFRFVRTIKEDIGLTDIPVIILTSGNMRGIENRYRDDPTVTLLERPFTWDNLRTAIEYRSPEKRPISKPEPEANAIRILAADDDPINLVVIKSFLNMAGYNVDTVKDGVEAVKAVMNVSYDLILMDICMPIMDGVFATMQIREIEKKNDKPPVPIVAVTAHFTPSQRQRYLDVGMNDVIAKPINKLAIDECLRKWSSRSTATHNKSVSVKKAAVG